MHNPQNPKTPKRMMPGFTPQEKAMWESFADFLDSNPRRIKRMLNCFNVMRQLQPGNEEPVMRKMLKMLILFEQWPYRMTWLTKVVEDDGSSVNRLGSHMPLQKVFKAIEEYCWDLSLWDGSHDQVYANRRSCIAMDSCPNRFERLLNGCGPEITVADLQPHGQLMQCMINRNQALDDRVGFQVSQRIHATGDASDKEQDLNCWKPRVQLLLASKLGQSDSTVSSSNSANTKQCGPWPSSLNTRARLTMHAGSRLLLEQPSNTRKSHGAAVTATATGTATTATATKNISESDEEQMPRATVNLESRSEEHSESDTELSGSKARASTAVKKVIRGSRQTFQSGPQTPPRKARHFDSSAEGEEYRKQRSPRRSQMPQFRAHIDSEQDDESRNYESRPGLGISKHVLRESARTPEFEDARPRKQADGATSRKPREGEAYSNPTLLESKGKRRKSRSSSGMNAA
eukprot:TRINITY_DN21812_c1_g1_i1.p1 TRINITY_DN21812_c1_g1~~TRINITY_DN21812_c1_g1_i1.p1  ORF type:complete len:460 (+),score=76.09 TRINITY_DN21812_c1_g1_i1:99-1478(+)